MEVKEGRDDGTFGMVDRHIQDKRKREKNTTPLGLQCQAYVVCVYICMYAHTYGKKIYGFCSPEKHVKLQGKEEEEEYGRRGG
jgi:hypothetical protein